MMIPTLKWKRSNRQLFSSSSTSTSSSRDREITPSSSSSSSAANAPVPICPSTARQDTHQQIIPYSTALTIPEIVLSIAGFLNRPSLVSCTLVCKDWNVIFQPLLFRVIEGADFDRPDFVRAFQDHTRFATSIEWIQELPVAIPAPKKTTWHRIFRKKAPIKPHVSNRKPFEQLVNSLLAGQTPVLETLSVRVQNQDPNLILRLSASTVVNLQISTRGYPARKPRLYMEDIMQAYPNLVHLTLEGLYTLTSHVSENGSSHGTGEGALSLSLLPPEHVLTHAHVPPIAPPAVPTGAIAMPTAGLSISLPTVSPPQAPFGFHSTIIQNEKGKGVDRSSSIQTLNLRLVDISQDGLIAISVLLPQLKNLLIEEFLVPDMMIKIYRWAWSTEFIHSLRMSFPHLRSLRLAIPFDSIKEDTIIEILKSFPLLTTVGFRNSYFGKRAMEALEENCKQVECLDVSFGCASRDFKGALLRFLHTWSRLRELEADGVVFHLDTPVDDDVPRIPWACTGLEKLVCGFHGTESMIFQHLAQFPRMSSLTISYPSLTISPIESTLAWMAKSTRMEYFWFPQHRHIPLEKSTILWILKHWPNLKKLHVAGGVIEQKETVKQWCRNAQRMSLVVEYDRY